MEQLLLAVAGALALLWFLAGAKTSRADGTLVRGLHPNRRLMPFIMTTRTESVVTFDSAVRAEELERYLARAKESLGADVTHCLVAAAAIGLAENPRLNRFVAGRRIYQRRAIELTFSMKRAPLDSEAKISIVKLEVDPSSTFRDLVVRIGERIGVERSGARTSADREYDLLNLLPRPVLAGAVRAARWLDDHNLLPPAYVRSDALFASLVISNLGSLGMGAGYHHLYEWGNCPLFLMAGRIEDRAVVEDGRVVARRILPLRWTYDERIDDGLAARHGIDTVVRVLEDPFGRLGSIEPDGRDAPRLGISDED